MGSVQSMSLLCFTHRALQFARSITAGRIIHHYQCTVINYMCLVRGLRQLRVRYNLT